ncbi:hypothetical protein B7492_16060 [Bacillus mycoides]|uniref:Spermidine/putrescine ABC transporter ATP-binding protein n=1 Tax=Bacillus mycoides TaxID=1405 RepID=A0A1W6A9U8_BACMY|nr:hypothetical protein B7492_16060 [Bacillus mycoides]
MCLFAIQKIKINYIRHYVSTRIIFKDFMLSRYLRAVKLPPQNSGGAKKLGGRSTARKGPIGEG